MSDENKMSFELESASYIEKTRPMNMKSSAAGAGILEAEPASVNGGDNPNRSFCRGSPDNLLDFDKSKTI